ncbi:hypothetical protein [Floridanema evergladense]|uniref:Uncharacterized protein n=1 Tax=Floridaenema evergladense BLCC-F167 TaxID=3153639 RepID=A0ABV4WI90_9CYAN
MKIEFIEQEMLEDTDTVMTIVAISSVNSQCVLARLMIDILGRPGIDNDMQFMGSGDRWTITWTEPNLPLDVTQTLVNLAINPQLSLAK